MANLNQDGLPVFVDGVEIVTHGLAGTVEVHTPGDAGMRGAEDASVAFLQALINTSLVEQVTVEIRDHQEVVAGSGSRTRLSDDDIQITVAGPGTGFGQFVLYEAEDGSLSWHLPEGVAPSEVPIRGPAQLTYRVPRAIMPLGSESAQRGVLGALGKKLLKVLFFRLATTVLGAAGNWFAAQYEAEHRPHRVRTFDTESYRATGSGLLATDWDRLSSGRALLFVHGTFSTSQNGFRMLPESLMEELHAKYGGRVLALDHPTISVSPTENARWFADQLPSGVKLELDVLAHSRGGLVSRVMAEQAEDVGLTGRVSIRTLVMVATPNAGTALADQAHIKQLMDRFTNLFQFLPDSGVIDGLEIVLSVLKQLAIGVFQGLEGLMSMNPKGQFLESYLNVAASTESIYHAVAADYDPPKGSPLLRIARDGVADLVFGGEANDLVVPTRGAYDVPGSVNFPIVSPLIFSKTDEVDHSTYWSKDRFVSAARGWLAG